jgi:hypothetical protein
MDQMTQCHRTRAGKNYKTSYYYTIHWTPLLWAGFPTVSSHAAATLPYSNLVVPLCILDFWSSHTTCGHHPSDYVLDPHSIYIYIPIRTHHVSNQHVTVFSPDHLHAHISCCIVTVISPRNLLCAPVEHPEDTFSPSTRAYIISPIVKNATFQFTASL